MAYTPRLPTTLFAGAALVSTNSEAISGLLSNKVLVPSNLSSIFGSPPSIGGTAPNSAIFISLNVTGLTASQAVVTDSSKNLISLAYSATGGISNLVSRDSNGNTFANNFTSGITSTSASGSPVNLNPNATRLQITTGTGGQTYKLPNATQLNLGTRYDFNNNATGNNTINDNSNTLVTTLLPGAYKFVIATNIGSPAGSWDTHSVVPANVDWGSSTLTASSTDAQFNSIGAGTAASGTSGVITANTSISSPTIFLTNSPTINYVWTCTNTSTGAGSWLPIGSGGSCVTSAQGTAPIQINGSSGVSTTGNITISATPATTSNLGVASFNSTNFSVTSGAVNLSSAIVTPGTLAVNGSLLSNSSTTFNSTSPFNCVIQGTSTNTTGSTFSQAGLVIQTVFNASNNLFTTGGITNVCRFNVPSTKTMSLAAAYYAAVNSSGNVGTITKLAHFYSDVFVAIGGTATNVYGFYGADPGTGTASIAAYFANLSVGYPSTNLTGTNYAIFSNNVSIGSSSTTSLFNVGSSNEFQINSSGSIVAIGSPLTSNFGGTGFSSYTDGQILVGQTSSGNIIKGSLVAGTGISISFNNSSGVFTISNSGGAGDVTGIVGTANQVLANGTSGTSIDGEVTLTLPQSIATSSNVQFGKLGIGVSPITNAGIYFNRLVSDIADHVWGFYHLPKIAVSAGMNLTDGGGIYVNTDMSNAQDGTFTRVAGILVDTGVVNTTGTFTTGYGIYCAKPAFGVTKIAMYSQELVVGSSYSTTAPPTNGAIIQGSVGIGVSSVTSNSSLDVVRTTDSGNFSSNFIALSSNTSQFWNGAQISVKNSSTTVNTYSGIAFVNGNGLAVGYFGSQVTNASGSIGSGDLYFGTVNSGSISEKMRILANGNIGIATSSPLNKLDINGALVVGTYAGSATAPSNTIMSSGGYISGSGTASSPAYKFFTDNTAGMYYTSNTVNFSTSSTLRATINSSGITIPSPGLLYTDTGTSSGGLLHHGLRTTGSVLRFGIGLSSTETGSGNTGSNFNIYRYDDTGSFLGVPVTILRSNGNFGLNDAAPNVTLSIVGNCAIGYSSGQLVGANSLGVAGALFIGPTYPSGGINNGALSSSPNSSNTTTAGGGGFGTTMSFNTAVQNTTGGDILLHMEILVASATSATITCGTSSSSSVTGNTAITTFSGANRFTICAYVPLNYYVKLSSTGTISVTSVTTIAYPI